MELAVLDRVYASVRDYGYEVRGITEPDALGLILTSAIAGQLWRDAGPRCNWSHLDPGAILKAHEELPEGMFNDLYVGLYAFITWLHHNEGVPGYFASNLQTQMDAREPPAVTALREATAHHYADPASRLNCPTTRAQRDRHAELVRRRNAN